MNPIIKALSEDPNIAAEFRAALPVEKFRAQCGRRRVFLSQSDADAYDDGYSAGWFYEPARFAHGPYADGWHDADQDQQDRDDARVERYLRETEE